MIFCDYPLCCSTSKSVPQQAAKPVLQLIDASQYACIPDACGAVVLPVLNTPRHLLIMQAMAVASEALNLATIMETGTRHGTEERALVAQIEEAARIVAIRAREIAGQPLELGDVGASVMQGFRNQ